MTGRRGIFFNSKSRSIDTNLVLDEKISNPSQEDPSTSPPKTTAAIGKKKLILKNTKRTLNKTIYSGPRRIFSTSYKANRAQLNHKAFFGADTDEYDLESTERICSSQTTTVTKRSVIVKSKSTDNIRTTTTTITENGKTKIICPRNQKKMYTVVSNIRQPTTCEELGETQSYIDDMEYLLAGFQSDKILNSRCLSAIKFAELCSKASFRMHLRTQSALERVFELLKDAPDIPSLNLCTAFIFFVLSSDTLTSGITPSTLRLMIELVQKSSLKTNDNDDEYEKIKQKIFHLILQTNQDEIFYEQKFNTCDLILETLVNITRNHLKDWLRTEARIVNVFDFIIDSISSIVQDLSNNDFECYSIGEIIIRYRKVCRYINMLEEFSSNNNQQQQQQSEQSSSSQTINIDLNRMYIAQYNQYLLFHSLSKLLDLSLVWFKEYSSIEQSKMSDTCEIFRDGCKTILLLFIVLTNDCELHCDRLTMNDRFFSNLLRLLVIIEQSSLPNEDKFDALALALNLLINLVQNTKHLYKSLMEDNMPGESSQKIYEYLAHIFFTHEFLAAKAESQEENDWMMEEEDDDLDERLGIQNPKNTNNNENTGNFNRALQKAAGHMENTFVAAFAGIILGVVLLRDHLTYANQIKALLPDKSFDTLAFILKKFFFFLRMSHAFTPSGVKTLEEITALIFSLRE